MDFFRTLALAGVVVVSGVAAQAATVTINVSSTAIDVECDGSATQPCYGLVGGSWDATGDPASLSLTNADLYPVTPNSEAAEAQALDLLIDGIDNDDFVGTDGSKTDAGGVDALSFYSNAEYIAFKTGAGHFFLNLFGAGEVMISFDKNGQQAGGLSHYTEFGEIDPIPLPAAGWLLLGGLGGLAAMKRRRKS